MTFRDYSVSIKVNDIMITKVTISSHYEAKHAGSIDDSIILKLVQTLNGKVFDPETVDAQYKYFVNDKIELNDKFYKLVWLLEKDQIYIGVVNAYRR